jgi:hypothetical protein
MVRKDQEADMFRGVADLFGACGAIVGVSGQETAEINDRNTVG